MSTVGLSFNIGKYSNWGRYNTFSKKQAMGKVAHNNNGNKISD